MECGMARRFHRGFTTAEKTELPASYPWPDDVRSGGLFEAMERIFSTYFLRLGLTLVVF